MLRVLSGLSGYKVQTSDRELGKVEQFLYDEESWLIRYLVVRTGGLFNRERFLLSPYAILGIAWQPKEIRIAMSLEQLQSSPQVDISRPLSKDFDISYSRHFGWPSLWDPAGLNQIGPLSNFVPELDLPDELLQSLQWPENDEEEKHPDEPAELRSSKETLNFAIQAADGRFGHIEDFVADDTIWLIRHLVIDTRNYWPSKSVLIATDWITGVDWDQKVVETDLSKDEIRSSPPFDPNAPINSAYEKRLYDFYGRPLPWSYDLLNSFNANLPGPDQEPSA